MILIKSSFWEIFEVRILSLLFVDYSLMLMQAVSSGTARIVEGKKRILEFLGGSVLMISFFCGI